MNIVSLVRPEGVHQSLDTGRRIFAYLHSLKFMDMDSSEPVGRHGREILERLAIDSVGREEEPDARLTPAECIDVLEFMAVTQPKDLDGWLRERDAEPSVHCGLLAVLNVLVDSLRSHQESEETP